MINNHNKLLILIFFNFFVLNYNKTNKNVYMGWNGTYL